MMENNWENFLKNLGEWQGSFTAVSVEGELLDSKPSMLTLEGFENNQLVHFRLRRFGPGGYSEPPLSDYSQAYRSLGKQAIFFARLYPFTLHNRVDQTRSPAVLAGLLPTCGFQPTFQKV